MDVLVAYDIADTDGPGARRLRAIADVCTSYGTRVQFSVFECRVSPEAYVRLIGEITDVIEPGQDSVLIYTFNGPLASSRTRLGHTRTREVDDPWII